MFSGGRERVHWDRMCSGYRNGRCGSTHLLEIQKLITLIRLFNFLFPSLLKITWTHWNTFSEFWCASEMNFVKSSRFQKAVFFWSLVRSQQGRLETFWSTTQLDHVLKIRTNHLSQLKLSSCRYQQGQTLLESVFRAV